MKTAAEKGANGVVNMTANKRVHFHVRLSDADIEVTTWCIAETVRIVNQLERGI